jgi:hypothetical protein
MIGDTMMRLNRVADALSYYQTARRLQSAPAARRTLLRKVASAKAQLRIERENAARQPLLHEALEQDRLVRPQINVMARAAHASKPTTSKGEEKQ